MRFVWCKGLLLIFSRICAPLRETMMHLPAQQFELRRDVLLVHHPVLIALGQRCGRASVDRCVVV